MAEQFRVIVLKDAGVYVAQCLEVDVSAQGATPDEAMQRLGIAFRAEVREAKQNGKSIMDIGPAPASYSAMYEIDIVEKTALVA